MTRGGFSFVLGVVVLASAGTTACSQEDRRPIAADARTEQGRVLMTRYHCGSCHVIPKVPDAMGQVAVSLEAFGRRSYIAGRVPNTEDQLVRWLIDPASVVPGTLMPSMGVSEGDARLMAAYLRSLP